MYTRRGVFLFDAFGEKANIGAKSIKELPCKNVLDFKTGLSCSVPLSIQYSLGPLSWGSLAASRALVNKCRKVPYKIGSVYKIKIER